MSNRYELKNLPISEATFKGLTPENIDYISAVGRMLLVQDKETERIIGAAYDQHAVLITDEVRKMLNEFRGEMFGRFDKMETQIRELTGTVDCTKLEVEKLKRLNSWWAIALRISIGVVIAVFICWYLYNNFWHK
jgi:hypothetical protein